MSSSVHQVDLQPEVHETSYVENDKGELLIPDQEKFATLQKNLKEAQQKLFIFGLAFIFATFVGFACTVLISIFFTIYAANNRGFQWDGPLGWEDYFAFTQAFHFGYGFFVANYRTVDKMGTFIKLNRLSMIGCFFVGVIMIVNILQASGSFNINLGIVEGDPVSMGAEMGLVGYLAYLVVIQILSETLKKKMLKRESIERKILSLQRKIPSQFNSSIICA